MTYIIHEELAAEILLAAREIVNESYTGQTIEGNFDEELKKRTDALNKTYVEIFNTIQKTNIV